MALRIVPVNRDQAYAAIRAWHRHHVPPLGYRYALGCAQGDRLVGVATAGRPVSRHLDDGLTIEVTRVATDGTRNACSALYGACWRAARALGYRRAVTYTHAGESGASLRAAGCTRRPGPPGPVGTCPAGAGTTPTTSRSTDCCGWPRRAARPHSQPSGLCLPAPPNLTCSRRSPNGRPPHPDWRGPPAMTDLTLADLARQYRERATSLGQHAADAEAQPERKAYHAGLAQHCRFVAADWSALAALVEYAAPRTTASTDALLATAGQRLAERLEDIHGH